MSYQAGTHVVLTCTFKVDDVLTDPTTVTLTVRDPEGTEAEYGDVDLTDGGTGVRSMTIALPLPGIWWYRWNSEGAAAGLEERQIRVLETVIEPPA